MRRIKAQLDQDLNRGPLRPKVKLTLCNVTAILENIRLAANTENIGIEDTKYTPAKLYERLNRGTSLLLSDVESGLWACQQMYEAGKFWHPKGSSYPAFLKQLGINYDQIYGWIKKPQKRIR